jgi:hypothetical protein
MVNETTKTVRKQSTLINLLEKALSTIQNLQEITLLLEVHREAPNERIVLSSLPSPMIHYHPFLLKYYFSSCIQTKKKQADALEALHRAQRVLEQLTTEYIDNFGSNTSMQVWHKLTSQIWQQSGMQTLTEAASQFQQGIPSVLDDIPMRDYGTYANSIPEHE